MGLFSRTKEAVDAGRGDAGRPGAPFDTVRRSPRNTRKPPVADRKFDAGAPLDPAETTKTRARRRLIGAVALALAAIVFVPMLFDRTPVPPSDDIALQIPDRDTPFEGRRGVPDPSKPASKSLGDLATAGVPISPMPLSGEPAAPAAIASTSKAPPVDGDAARPDEAEVVTPKVERPVVAKAAEKPAEKVAEKPVEKVAEKAVEKPKPATTPSDDPRAIAALEGRSDASTSAASPVTGRTYAVQIAAYAAPEKARGMRDQLVAGGLKSYVESVSTPQGLRTRVRLGPFATREAADKARAKLKTMKLDGSVVPL